MALGESLEVPFTFFVNMGRAFDPWISLSKAIGRRLGNRPRGALPAAMKLGWPAVCRAAIFNPRAGHSGCGALREAQRAGHEIGLHGGRNHARWERSAQHWDERKLQGEIRAGLRAMESCGLTAPTAFASPAWVSPPALRPVLRAHGFRVLADASEGSAQDVAAEDGLLLVPTNITAGGSAGYLETARLGGWNGPRLRADFIRQIRTKKHLAVVYDHPFFAGTHALDQVGELVRCAQDEGFRVCTISAAAEALQAATAATQP